MRRSKLIRQQKLLAIVISALDQGKPIPSNKELGDALGPVAESTIKQYITELRQAGYLRPAGSGCARLSPTPKARRFVPDLLSAPAQPADWLSPRQERFLRFLLVGSRGGLPGVSHTEAHHYYGSVSIHATDTLVHELQVKGYLRPSAVRERDQPLVPTRKAWLWLNLPPELRGLVSVKP